MEDRAGRRSRRAGAAARHLFRDRTLAGDGADAQVVAERGAAAGRTDNERLEFLGDAVLALVVSDLLMAQLPDAPEGELVEARAALVSEGGLARAAARWTWGGSCSSGAARSRRAGARGRRSWPTRWRR